MNKNVIRICFVFVISFLVISQNNAQSISGYVFDLTNHPIEHAFVQIYLGYQKNETVYTDEKGFYEFNNLNKGKYILLGGHLEYDSKLSDTIDLKGTIENYDFKLTNFNIIEDPIIISETPINNLSSSLLKSKYFSQMAGAYDDPSRLLIKMPTISTPSDQANFITAKGLPPHLVKWSIQGTEIVNPNHLSNAGTISDQASPSAGGINMINARMMRDYNFHFSPLPHRFYNALTGYSDVNLSEKHGLDFSLGLLGTELDYGWNNKKNSNRNNYQSLHVNYRYSTLGLLSAIGVDLGDEEIQFQDLAIYHQYSDGKRILNSYAILGNNKNYHAPIREDIEILKDAQDILFQGAQAMAGTNFTYQFNSDFSGHSNHAFSYRSSERSFETDTSSIANDLYSQGESNREELLYSTNNYFRFRIKKWDAEIGNNFSYRTVSLDTFQANEINTYAYLSVQKQSLKFLRLSSVNASVGVSYLNTFLPDIRIGFNKLFVDISNRPFLAFRASFQGQSIDPILQLKNPELEAFSSFNTGIDIRYKSFRTGVFYHEFFNLPYSSYPDRYTYLDGYEGLLNATLVNGGYGRIYGVQAQYEIKKTDKYLLLLGASYYDLVAGGEDGINRSSQYNFRYTLSGSFNYHVSKKWNLGIAYHGRGGAMDKNRDFFVYVPNRLKAYNRIDFRAIYSYGKKYKQVLSLDIQNVFSLHNEAYYFYDPLQQSFLIQDQLGIIPVLKWTITLF